MLNASLSRGQHRSTTASWLKQARAWARWRMTPEVVSLAPGPVWTAMSPNFDLPHFVHQFVPHRESSSGEQMGNAGGGAAPFPIFPLNTPHFVPQRAVTCAYAFPISPQQHGPLGRTGNSQTGRHVQLWPRWSYHPLCGAGLTQPDGAGLLLAFVCHASLIAGRKLIR